MSNLNIQLPDSLYKSLLKLAEQDGVSLDQFIALAVAEKIAALTTEGYLQERASHGDRTKYNAASIKVADVEPAAEDRIPPAEPTRA